MSETPLRLVVFDVDGTLVDSQADILDAMRLAFEGEGLQVPSRSHVLGIVGLSLDELMLILAPDCDAAQRARLVQGYKDAYTVLRADPSRKESSPFYPGARAILETLQAQPETLLGVATGKSKRGLDKLIEAHGLEGVFFTQQTADTHPSKPHPSMLLQALRDSGAEVENAVMIGDTSFDMEMAAAAGMMGIAVEWGYHPVARLGAARHRIASFEALPALLQTIWKG